MNIRKLYSEFRVRKLLFILVLIMSLVALTLFSISLGSADIGIREAFTAISSKLFSLPSSPPHLHQTIIWELRLPRVLMAIVAGIGFSIGGVLLQAILKNPLASPYTLGIGSGAAFGASLALVLGAGITGMVGFFGKWMIVTNAFLLSLAPAAIILGLTRFRNVKPSTMILAGVAMMFIFSASTSLLQYLGTEEQITAVVYWMFGSLSRADWSSLGIVSAVTLPIFIGAFRWSWDLNVLLQGDETAKSLGVNLERVRIGGMFLTSLVTGAAVAFLGTIGFIGLVAPHIARMVIGSDHRFLIPASCLVGSILLLGADTIARTVLSPIILPVGIVTSYLGVPVFIYLILRRRKEYW